MSNEEIDPLHTNFTDYILSPTTSTAIHYSEFIQPGVSGVFFLSFSLSTVGADQQRILHCTTYYCYLFPSGDCALLHSILLTCLHSWRADRRASRGVCCYCAPPFLSSHFWFVVLDPVFDLPRGFRLASPLQLARLYRLTYFFCLSHHLSDMPCSVDLPQSPIQL